MLVDKNGDQLTSGKKPLMNEVAVRTVYDKYSLYPSNGLTPQRLSTIFKEADVGNIYRQMELFEEMEEKDTHLSSILQTRKNAILGLNWDIMSYSEDERDKVIADSVRAAFEFEGFEDSMLDLLDGIGKGFAVSEIMWELRAGKVMVKSLEWKHQKKFLFDEDDNLRVLTPEAPSTGILLPDNKFVVHRYKARSGHPTRAGVLRVIAWMYLFKNYTLKDWVAFAEVYGMPIRLGKYDSTASKEDKEALMKALIMLGTDAAGIISKSTEIELKEAVKNSGTNIYEKLAGFCNSEMSKAVLGQTMTTEISGGGSYAASKTHGDVRQDLVEADCKALAETLRKHLVKPLVMFNFGDTSRLPWIKFHYELPEDLEKLSTVYGKLVKEVGLKIPAKHVYETFGIPEPQAGEAVLSPSTAPDQTVPNVVLPNKDTLKALSDKPQDQQDIIDRIADKLTALGIFGKLTAPVMEVLKNATSFDEIQARLPEIYPQMDKEELSDLLQRALFTADILGRMEVESSG